MKGKWRSDNCSKASRIHRKEHEQASFNKEHAESKSCIRTTVSNGTRTWSTNHLMRLIRRIRMTLDLTIVARGTERRYQRWGRGGGGGGRGEGGCVAVEV